MIEKRFAPDTQAMEALGAELSHYFTQGGVMTLHGDLGVGKTTLVRGFLNALGHEGKVKSPTYTLVEEYALAGRMIYHFDLYRLHDPEELEYMGIRDYLAYGNLCLFEWPEKAGELLTLPDMKVSLFYHEQGREIIIEGNIILNI